MGQEPGTRIRSNRAFGGKRINITNMSQFFDQRCVSFMIKIRVGFQHSSFILLLKPNKSWCPMHYNNFLFIHLLTSIFIVKKVTDL